MNRDASMRGFTPIGKIIRSQGLNGELKVDFETDSPEVAENLSIVYLQNDRGDFYPVRISEIRTEEKGNINSFFVQFEQIADRTAAEALRNQHIYLEFEEAEAFLGTSAGGHKSTADYEVFNEDQNYVGLVTDVMENPAHPILIVATTSGSLLIPCVDEYVAEINHEEKSIRCQNLSQLEDL